MENQRQFLRTSPNIKLVAHHSSLQNGSRKGKVKLCEFHAVRSWVLFVADSSNGTVAIVDYSSGVRVFEHSIYGPSGGGSEGASGQTTQAAATDKNKLLQRAINHSSCELPIRSSKLLSLALSVKEPVSVDASLVAAKTKQYAIASKAFWDDDEGDDGHRPNPQERSKLRYSPSTGYGALVVCDHALIFCGLEHLGAASKRSVGVISAAEIIHSTPKAAAGTGAAAGTICCAEVIHADTVAVACSDGLLRLWDCLHCATVKAIATAAYHGKFDICAIKLVPRKQDPVSSSGDHVRFITIAADGSAVMWEVAVQFGIVDTDLNGGAPIARFRDTLGVMAAAGAGGGVPGQAALSSSSLLYDFESDTLHTCAAERVIKVWDLSGPKSFKHGPGPGPGAGAAGVGASPAPLQKRQSLRRSSLFGSSAADGADQLAIVPCLSKVKMEKSPAVPPHLTKVLSFALLKGACVPPNVYVSCSKSGSLALLQRVESAGGDEMSETSSVKSGGLGDAPDKMVLLHELHVDILLNSSQWEEPGLKIYCVRVHPSQPHLLALGTSMGLVIVALPMLPAGPLFGTHPRWEPGTHLCCDGNSGGGGGAGVVRRVVSEVASEGGGERVLASEPAEEHNVLTAQTASLGIHRSGSLSSVAAAGSGLGSGSAASTLSFQSPGPLSRRLSLSRSKPAGPSAGPPLLGYCRPVFLPSPSGIFCAVVWPDAATYIVLRVGEFSGRDGFRPTPMQQVDKGPCAEFGWVGGSSAEAESYLLKVPGFVALQPAEKDKAAAGRRSSLADMLFSSKRDPSRAAHPPDLVLRALPITAAAAADQTTSTTTTATITAIARPLKQHSKTGTLLSAENISELHGGSLLLVNYAPLAPTPPAAAAPPVATADPQHAPAALRVARFFQLVESRHLAAIDEAVAQERAAVLASRGRQGHGQGQGAGPAKAKVRSKVAADAVQGDGEAGGDGSYSLLPVGPVMAAAAMVRWSYHQPPSSSGPGPGKGGDCCAMLMSDSAVVNVLQLTLEPIPAGSGPGPGPGSSPATRRMSLCVLASVDLSGGGPPALHLSVTGLHWTAQGGGGGGGGLLLWAASHNTVSVVAAASTASARYADVITLPHTESAAAAVEDRPAVAAWLGKAKQRRVTYSPWYHCEPLGERRGFLHLAFRDGAVKALCLSAQPVAVAALLPMLLSCRDEASGEQQRERERELGQVVLWEALRRAAHLDDAAADVVLRMLLKRLDAAEVLSAVAQTAAADA